MTEFFRKFRIPLILFSGFLLGLTLLFPQIGALEWIALVPFAAVMYGLINDKGVKLWKFLLYGGLFSASFYITIYYWLIYMHVELERSNSESGAWALAIFMWLGLSFLYAVFGSVAVLIFAAISRSRIAQNIKFLQPLIFAGVWSVFEWLQNFGWWGVPWGRLAIGQTEMGTMMQSVALFGTYFLTFLILAVNFMLGYMFMHPQRIKVITGVCLAIILCNFTFGAISTLTYKDEGEPVRVAVLQGNMSSLEKWETDKVGKTKEIYRELTLAAVEDGAELVVWPETALPYVVFASKNLSKYVLDLAGEAGVTMIVSALTEGAPYGDPVYDDEDSKLLYNSMIEAKPDGTFGETMYHKQHLVPFGEMVPMRDIIMTVFPPLANVGMLSDDLLAGHDSNIMDTDVGRVGCIICFDSIYEHVAVDATRDGAQLLSISTNDSWFKDSRAGYMHTAQAKLRAVECGRYIVRAGNTGISAIITPTGEVIEYLEPMVKGYLCDDIYMRDNMTLYLIIGDVFVYLCIFLLALCIIVSIYIDARSKRRSSGGAAKETPIKSRVL